MICSPCAHQQHHDCMDLERRAAQDKGLIPAVAPNTSMWCYCAHEPAGSATRADLKPDPRRGA